MSMTFTKLFSSITESSIWMQDDHTRIVWIAMLAMSDKRGRVWASVPGLANRSRVPVASVERAISIFLAPDTYSRTKDNEGQRIAEIDGGWRLLNHQKYRDMRDDEDRREQNREAQQRARAKVSKLADSQQPSANSSANSSAQAEAEAEAEARKREGKSAPLSEPEAEPEQPPAAVRLSDIPKAEEVVAHGALIGVPEANCRAWHAERVSEGWADRSGLTIGNWRAFLRGWRDSRRTTPPTGARPEGLSTSDKILADKELGRVETRIKDISGSVDSHRELSQADRAERRKLKDRAEVLRKQLGFSV